jgi:hypothetical protein
MRSFPLHLAMEDVSGIISCFHELSPILGQITYVLLTRAPLSEKSAPEPLSCPQAKMMPPVLTSHPVRLACLKRAASVRSEPGSNSP